MSSFISPRLNLALLEEKYEQWQRDPQSLDGSWSSFFEGFELGLTELKKKEKAAVPAQAAAPASGARELLGSGGDDLDISAHSAPGKIVSLVYNYRTLGHTQAQINPLEENSERNPRLEPAQYQISEEDMDLVTATPFFRSSQRMTVREMVEALEETYSGNIGFEFMHIHATEVRNWIRQRIEGRFEQRGSSVEEKKRALRWLMEAELFEEFLGKKFLGEKRFSLEGGEGLMILLNHILEQCPEQGVAEIEMGMAHRGRLNVLANFVKKSLTTILYEFTPEYVHDEVAGDGDVKYHLGYEKVRKLENGEVRVSLAANPSHLEAVNAVVEGKARARQRILGDDEVITDRSRVLPILIHGDAAFAGQGSVAEVLNLSQLRGYRTGGTIHLIVNNQIGFTTMPSDARSSSYATDVAKMIEVPILHVNGEKPEELLWAAAFALEFRQKWHRDVIIDMYCYRRQGHNENDQAAFTQPHIYRDIQNRKTFGRLYGDQLVAEGVLSEEEVVGMRDEIWNGLEKGLEDMRAKSQEADRNVFTGSTAEIQPAYKHDPVLTGISQELFSKVGNVLVDIPKDFRLHPTLAKRFVPRRAEALEKGEEIDWALGEALAFGSLLDEGYPVRLSGQDCRRGTFSQRHAVFYDFNSRERYIPLEHVSPDQAKFCVYNSLLSEAAVLGFDYGYSLGCPSMLILWEAQFGDFSNGAQVIIDQFISSAESKWQTPSSLVMLLPHGYEGMGPEHSSARIERYLQLCAEDNMIVANFTTPAQYFHALRRQKHSKLRKPLIVFTPKSLLTHPRAVSRREEFLDGSSLQEIIPDREAAEQRADQVRRAVFCSGKVYYDLLAYQEENQRHDVALIRVEQFYPFHHEAGVQALEAFPHLEKLVWCQEEPLNMGGWTFMQGRLEKLASLPVRYAGRGLASSPATGSKAVHKREQKQLVDDAFNL